MVWTIYRHTNRVSGKCYVGLTKKTMEFRWRRGHVRLSRMGSDQPLHRAIAKYGEDVFAHEVLETCETLEAANEAEIWWIAHFGCDDLTIGYNLDAGGKSHNSNEESKAKIGAYTKARWAAMSDEERAAIAAKQSAGIIASMTPETIAKRKAWWASMSPEERTAMLTRNSTAEERRERALRAQAKRTPEQRSAAAHRGAVKRKQKYNHEAACEAAKRSWLTRFAAMTPEQQKRHLDKKASEGRGNWETRRANIAAACPAPSLRVNLLRLPPPAPRQPQPSASAAPYGVTPLPLSLEPSQPAVQLALF